MVKIRVPALISVFLICMFLLAGVGISSSPQPRDRKEWLQPSWWTALRDTRRLFPQHTATIYNLKQPDVKLVQGAFVAPGAKMQQLVLGWTDCEKGEIIVAITASEQEDWNSLIHEQLHWIGCYGGLTEEEQKIFHPMIDVEYSLGSR